MPPNFGPRHATGSLLPIADIAKKVKECAARRNMPFVQATWLGQTGIPTNVIRLDMPKQNRTLKLAAPLIVLCEQITSAPTSHSVQQSPKLLMMAAEYRFFFTSIEFDNLILKEITNTQAWRAAMRLPVKVIGNNIQMNHP